MTSLTNESTHSTGLCRGSREPKTKQRYPCMGCLLTIRRRIVEDPQSLNAIEDATHCASSLEHRSYVGLTRCSRDGALVPTRTPLRTLLKEPKLEAIRVYSLP